MAELRWYVYRVNLNGVLAYIGKGSKDRFLTSARRLGGIAGILESFPKESQALKREIELIAQFNPLFNRSKGGEGKTHSREWSDERRDRALERSWREKAYAEADKSGTWRSRFFAAAYARCELNSRGIKWPEVELDPEQVDPVVVSAIRRLNAWKQLPLPESLRSIICSR